jgi:hypothetical protein
MSRWVPQALLVALWCGGPLHGELALSRVWPALVYLRPG